MNSSIVAARDLVPVSTELGAAPVDCLVNIVGELRPTRASGGSVAEYSVGLDCAPIYRGERALTAAEKAGLGGGVSLQVFTRACVYANRMIGAGGEGDILTELTTRQDFQYDGLYVTWDSGSGSTYNHWSTGWGVISSWINTSISTVPTPDYHVDSGASFSFFGSWHHDKNNWTHAYGDGNCAFTYQHNGYVCRGCDTRFYVFYL